MESDFSRFSDIREMEISETMTPVEKKKDFIRKNGSDSMHKVGDIKVTCFYGDMNLEKMLADMICM